MTRPALLVFVAALTVLALAPNFASAKVEAARFETARQEALYDDMIGDMLWLVFAKQSMEESKSDHAKYMSGKVR